VSFFDGRKAYTEFSFFAALYCPEGVLICEIESILKAAFYTTPGTLDAV
jgi:hypothetical protein